ncbi:MAG: 2-oxoacid:acceptor oxidoreductase subunit alpha [Dehalococcoidia bacterium]|jgi:2-oxoglutarate ferredoxin oxidoreductase subunit alpha
MTDFNILVGGEAGQGVQSIGIIIARTMARGGFHVFADQDYESRVRGGHNFFRIRISDADIQAVTEKLDLLVALNRETVELHQKELKSGGTIIYDGESFPAPDTKKKVLDIPLNKIALDSVGNKLMANAVAAGAILGLVNYNFEISESVLTKEFARHGRKIIEDNIKAARAGFDFAGQHGRQKALPEVKSSGKKPKILLNGNEAIALGAMAAGCKLIAGYPMTPASSIMEYFAEKEKDYGVVAVHVEDEIAAINMAVGAGYAGVRSMVATSGGGFSLMVEGLALAGMTETPVVIVLGQRPGPATGLPTRTEQGELWFALHAGHGEFPRALLAPANAADAFAATARAFNLAEKYQTPVILLSDHHLATSYMTVDPFDLTQLTVDRGDIVTPKKAVEYRNYKRHTVTESGISPRALPGLSKALVVTDSDEHDEAGHMIEDALTRDAQNLKRLRKLNALRKEINRPIIKQSAGSDITLIGWGSACGAINEAAAAIEQDGKAVSTVCFNEIWPFPENLGDEIFRAGSKTVAIENNATGQLAGLIRRETGQKIDRTILKFDGRPFSPEYIIKRLKKEVFQDGHA